MSTESQTEGYAVIRKRLNLKEVVKMQKAMVSKELGAYVSKGY
jgi:hypothetical protein